MHSVSLAERGVEEGEISGQVENCDDSVENIRVYPLPSYKAKRMTINYFFYHSFGYSLCELNINQYYEKLASRGFGVLGFWVFGREKKCVSEEGYLF